MKIILRSLPFILILVAGCSSPLLEEELIGAWYGEEGPDDDLCLVFCGDGRMFSGDRRCDDSTASDFEMSSQVTINEDSFSVTFDDDPVVFTEVSISGDTMTYSFGGRSFQVTRTQVPDYCSSRP